MLSMKSLYPQFLLINAKRYFKAASVGVVTAVLQFILFNLLRLIWHPAIANAVSIEIAILNNFLLHNAYTFKDKRLFYVDCQAKKYLSKLIKFNLFSLISLTIQTLIVFLGVHLFGYGAVKENIFVITGIVFGSFINYFFYVKQIWN
ncbi:MAG: GtrA family protein [Pseudomonadota bacterium]